MWPFGSTRRELRILAHGNLILIERLKLMSAQIEAFKVAFDGLLARLDAAEANRTDSEALRNHAASLQAELDEAKAAIAEATEAALAKLGPPADPQPEHVE
jgi:hypothetical protein